jgi:hypothetical protein
MNIRDQIESIEKYAVQAFAAAIHQKYPKLADGIVVIDEHEFLFILQFMYRHELTHYTALADGIGVSRAQVHRWHHPANGKVCVPDKFKRQAAVKHLLGVCDAHLTQG